MRCKGQGSLRRTERQHTRGALLILGSNGIHRDALLPKFIFCQWERTSPAYLPFAFRTAPSIIIIGTYAWQSAPNCALAGNLSILISIHGGARIARMLSGASARCFT